MAAYSASGYERQSSPAGWWYFVFCHIFQNSYFTFFSNGIAIFGLPQSKNPYQIETDVPQNNITQDILCLETEKNLWDSPKPYGLHKPSLLVQYELQNLSQLLQRYVWGGRISPSVQPNCLFRAIDAKTGRTSEAWSNTVILPPREICKAPESAHHCSQCTWTQSSVIALTAMGVLVRKTVSDGVSCPVHG